MEKQYLANLIQEYVKEPAIVAVPAVPEYRDDESGKVIQVAIPAVKGKKAVMGKRVHSVFIENNKDLVAQNLEDLSCNIKYYLINATPRSCSTMPVKLSENRKAAPTRETVGIVAGGRVVDTAVV